MIKLVARPVIVWGNCLGCVYWLEDHRDPACDPFRDETPCGREAMMVMVEDTPEGHARYASVLARHRLGVKNEGE